MREIRWEIFSIYVFIFYLLARQAAIASEIRWTDYVMLAAVVIAAIKWGFAAKRSK